VSRIIAALLALAAPAAALAFGGHDSVGCTGCHSLHAAVSKEILAVPPNPKYLDPKTKKPYTATTAFCLACHAEPAKGGHGYLPIAAHTSHPFGIEVINPKVAKVPPEFMKDGKFECTACHDPHPSNPYWKYVRADVGPKGDEIDAFCELCHPAKGELRTVRAKVFDSMDETKPPTLPPVRAPAARAPAAAPPAGAPEPATAPAAAPAKPPAPSKLLPRK
jgi:hypothetical protein